MKPRRNPYVITDEDYAAWEWVLDKWPGPENEFLESAFSADRRDALIMLCLGCVRALGNEPRAGVLETLSVDELLNIFSKDRGVVYVPRVTYPSSHKRQ